MIVIQSTHPGWLSNTWLIAPGPGQPAVVIDAGAPPEPILRAIEEHQLDLRWVLLTHHHVDHVCEHAAYQTQPGARVLIHEAEAARVPGVDGTLRGSEHLQAGELSVELLHIPGHTAGQLAFRVNRELVCTGDTLFKGSVGGTRGPGHTSFADLQHSVLEVLLGLPPETRVLPGHAGETTVAAELEHNPFVRAFRGVDPVQPAACTALGEEAELLLRAADYDGGTKAWVRFADGRLDVVPGSRVTAR
ncbi:MAG: MBL fold metallo-hydrolase [Planctomycetes bacterium]|nr:MBL fold metallo-hydrolase [Planctomycetota bacterium]